MRTKIALLSAALVAAGVASSMAQSNVYSLNVVGYVNVSLHTGFNLISLPLQSADNTSSINSVLTNNSPVPAPYGSYVSLWNPATQSFGAIEYANGDTTWSDFIGNTSTNSIPPGQGFFFYLPTTAQQAAQSDPTPYITNLTVTVVGTVLQGTNSYPVSQGYSFYGNFEPVAQDLSTNGWPVGSNDTYQSWGGSSYAQILYGTSAADNGGVASFSDFIGNAAACVPAVGAGFFYLRGEAGTAQFTQVFNVQ